MFGEEQAQDKKKGEKGEASKRKGRQRLLVEVLEEKIYICFSSSALPGRRVINSSEMADDLSRRERKNSVV